MSKAYSPSIMIVILITVSAYRAHATTWSNVTVITSSGWEYTDMTVVCEAGNDYVTVINTDRGRKRLNFSDIQTIRDQGGTDITALVLSCATGTGEIAPPSELPPPRAMPPGHIDWPKEGSIDTTPNAPIKKDLSGIRDYSEPRFRLSPTLSLGYSITSGDWFEGFTSGILLHTAVRFAVKNDMFMGFAFRRQELGVEDELKAMCFYDDFGNYACANLEWDVVLEEMYLLIGFMTTPRKFSTPIGYGEWGIGAIQHDIETTAYYGEISESGHTDETKFAFMGGGGVLFPVHRRIGIDLALHFRVTGDFGSSYPASRDITGFLWGFQVGIAFFAGGN